VAPSALHLGYSGLTTNGISMANIYIMEIAAFQHHSFLPAAWLLSQCDVVLILLSFISVLKDSCLCILHIVVHLVSVTLADFVLNYLFKDV
jgi:hypothetical protein